MINQINDDVRAIAKDYPVATRLVLWLSVVTIAIPTILWVAGWILYGISMMNPWSAGISGWLLAAVDWKRGHLVGGGLQVVFSGTAAVTIVVFAPLLIRNHFLKVNLHGDARFANRAETRKSRLLQLPDRQEDLSIVVGRQGKKLLRFFGQQFVILMAPTRSGKGVGVVIPNLLNWTGSVVVLDVKKENYRKTAGYRQSIGQDVFLFNPFADDKEIDPETGLEIEDSDPEPRSHGWNPLDVIPKGPFRAGEIISIGTSIWPRTNDKNAFWNDSARNLFVAIVLFLIEIKEARLKNDSLPNWPVSLGEVFRQSSGRGTGQPIKDYIRGWTERFDFLSMECRGAIGRFLSSPDETLGNIISTFNAPLLDFMNPVVDAATNHSDFRLEDVRRKKISVYLGVQPTRLKESPLLFNLLFTQLVKLNTRQLPEDNPALKYPCLLLMDEFAALGKMDAIVGAVAFIAGYNLRLLTVIQSRSQLESARSGYGREDARNFVTNHALQILYTPRQQEDANEYSEMLGYFSETARNTSRSGMLFQKDGRTVSESEQKRALMLPQELKEMPQDEEIVLLENTKPIHCEKISYYQESYFTERLMAPPEVPMLKFVEHEKNGAANSSPHVATRPLNTDTDVDPATGRLKVPVSQVSDVVIDPNGAAGIEPPDATKVYSLMTLQQLGIVQAKELERWEAGQELDLADIKLAPDATESEVRAEAMKLIGQVISLSALSAHNAQETDGQEDSLDFSGLQDAVAG